MKRLLALFLISVCFLSLGTVSANIYEHPYPFIGRWQPTEDPALLDQFGIQDIQNLRKWGKHFRGVLGDSEINVDEISGDSSYYKPRSGFHFKKDDPQESHILVQAWNEAETESKVYQNTTTVPNRGEFSTTALHTDDTDAAIGRFTTAPQGNVVYCNGKESLIWGGDERLCHGFLLERDAKVSDRWGDVYKDDSDTSAAFTGGVTTWYVGSTRRMDRAKFYISTANASAATLSVEYWNGWAWVSVSSLSDGTSSGGKTLASTGTVSWAYTSSARTTFVRDNDGGPWYWYRFRAAGVDATTAIYYVTVGEGALRPIEDIWDGTLVNTAKVWFYGASGVSDITDSMNQSPPAQAYSEKIGGMTAGTHYFLIGATEKLRGLEVRFADGKVNTNAAGVTVQYFNGSAFSGVTGLQDGTDIGGDSFTQNGRIHWLPTEEWSAADESATTGFSTEAHFFYYKVYFDGNLSADVEPYYLRGIPAQDAKGDHKDLGDYAFGLMFQRRLLLFADATEGNKIIYSATDAPDVFNGSDSGVLYVGDATDITAAGVLFNVFVNAGYEQLIITKGHSTYRLYGNGPSEWILEQISDNVGCAAPGSFIIGESTQVESGVKRNVAAWQASHGYVECDGATIETISEDTACYWDPNDSRGIARHRLDDTQAWYNPDLASLKVLISSGAEMDDEWGDGDIWDAGEEWGVNWEDSVTDHNAELEYSFNYKEWTKLYREDTDGNARPLQCGFQVKDTDNQLYTYGGADNGIIYRLEHTNAWNRQPIEQYLRTGDIMLGTGEDANPFFNHSSIDYVRLLYKNKAFGSGETITVAHWGDGIRSVTGTSGYLVPEDIDMSTRTFNTQDCFMGPALKHSFEFRATTSTQDYGMELLGLGIWFSPTDTILGVGE